MEGSVEDSCLPRRGWGVSGVEDIPPPLLGGGSRRGIVEGTVEDSSVSDGIPPGSGVDIFRSSPILYFIYTGQLDCTGLASQHTFMV